VEQKAAQAAGQPGSPARRLDNARRWRLVTPCMQQLEGRTGIVGGSSCYSAVQCDTGLDTCCCGGRLRRVLVGPGGAPHPGWMASTPAR
jgi:hypothetical protein